MNCEEADRLLDAYLDRELAESPQLKVERHLRDCDACRSRAREAEAFRSFFRKNAPRYRAPMQLRASILDIMRPRNLEPRFTFCRTAWLYAAAALVFCLCLCATIFLPDREKQLCDAAVLDHSRSLAADHLVDVASGDRRVVKSWFGARLPFSPPVGDLSIPGCSLLGGRVVAIKKRPVAVIVYRRDKEVISLYCWPVRTEPVTDRVRQIDGYRVGTWSNLECNYIVVSKLSERAHDASLDSLGDGNSFQPGSY